MILRRVTGLIDRLVRLGAYGAALALVALFLLGLSEVALRALSGSGLDFALEYSGYLVALAFFWGSGWTLQDGGHIRLTLLHEHLSPTVVRRLDIGCSLAGLVLSVLMSYALFDWALGSWQQGATSFYPSATPLAWPQFLLALGPMSLGLAFAGRLIRLMSGEDVR